MKASRARWVRSSTPAQVATNAHPSNAAHWKYPGSHAAFTAGSSGRYRAGEGFRGDSIAGPPGTGGATGGGTRRWLTTTGCARGDATRRGGSCAPAAVTNFCEAEDNRQMTDDR